LGEQRQVLKEERSWLLLVVTRKDVYASVVRSEEDKRSQVPGFYRAADALFGKMDYRIDASQLFQDVEDKSEWRTRRVFQTDHNGWGEGLESVGDKESLSSDRSILG
jgi:hypothetical protein